MNPRNTWMWMFVAAGLFAVIFFLHRRPPPTPGTGKILPGLKASAVTNVQVWPGTNWTLQAERTNGSWLLTKPMVYPAQGASIENLLGALEHMTPMAYISSREIKGRGDEEFGLAAPQATITLQQPDYHALVQIGSKTAPGDQVFLHVAGVDGVYVADAGLLKHLPITPNDWRDTTLFDLSGVPFDRVSVTNGTKIFELQCDPTNKQWRIVYPFYPLPARANRPKIEECLQRLQNLRVLQFLAEDPKPDLEALGLQPPELVLAIGLGTSNITVLQFGKSPTNDNRQVYARRLGQNAVVTVSADLLAPWRGKVNEFRDPHLVTLTEPVGLIEVHGQENFSIQLQTNDTWRVLPQDLPADSDSVKELLTTLTRMPIIEFVNDVVIAADLPTYGLAPPARAYILRSASTNSPGSTNALIAEIDFGTNQADKAFARRTDESFVYAVKATDYQQLPAAGWQLRERRLWQFTTNDVASLTISQEGRTRQITRNGPYSWSLAPGSQGIINDLAVEQTVSELGALTAGVWVGRGDENRARYGFVDKGLKLSFELKNGEKMAIEFGSEAPSGFRYAAVTLDQALWIFEFPPGLYQLVSRYLTIPPGTP